MPRTSVEQQRAARAFAAAREIDRELAKKLPVMLQTNGLLASFAFLMKKAEAARLRQVLLQQLRARINALVPEGAEIAIFERWCDAQHGLTGKDLRRLSSEALAFAVWLKRAAEAHDAG